MAEERRTPTQEARRLYEQAESQTAQAMEQLVGREGFGELLGRVTENAMALTRVGQGMLDMGVRNLRVAGREDVVRLARQLARTEDKLERVLQEVERLEQKLDDDYLVWYDVPIGPKQSHPDFTVLHPRRGLLVLEVKDWRLETIREADRQTFVIACLLYTSDAADE